MTEFEADLRRYLGREFTYQEERALRVVNSMVREMLRRIAERKAALAAERFEIDQERAEVDRRIESIKMQMFTVDWQTAECEMEGARS